MSLPQFLFLAAVLVGMLIVITVAVVVPWYLMFPRILKTETKKAEKELEKLPEVAKEVDFNDLSEH